MRILFCDDNNAILEQLRSYVSDYFKENGGQQPELVCYDNGDALLAAETRADIAFLDVEMPGINGIQLGAKLKEMNPHIKIFIVTSYPDYLDEAMRFRVFRYLSKAIIEGQYWELQNRWAAAEAAAQAAADPNAAQ